MSFEANIKITTVEEFKAITDPKLIEIPKVITKDKIVKEKVEVKVKIPSITCCPICGMETHPTNPGISHYDYVGLDAVPYQVIDWACPRCGYTYTANVKKDIK